MKKHLENVLILMAMDTTTLVCHVILDNVVDWFFTSASDNERQGGAMFVGC